MAQVHQVRELYFNQGKNLTQIAEEMDCDWRTVRKYVDQDDFSTKPPVPASKMRKTESKLDPFKPTIPKTRLSSWQLTFICNNNHYPNL